MQTSLTQAVLFWVTIARCAPGLAFSRAAAPLARLPAAQLRKHTMKRCEADDGMLWVFGCV